MMMSYLRGVANEALVFTARLWCLIIPTHRTSGYIGDGLIRMETWEWDTERLTWNPPTASSSVCGTNDYTE